ncbi:MAG: tRNA (adenosine(37)-N6)-threonylcarbamoyltransferase complex ATPase subunit type 1 TsaE, partial [Gammaproteobacteria bacterium]|nr:tRNA (adenosine(37)-N6)-threonylcarbamoyltransferase complex ATPase subunit type 1 TsaE [Gammaproteobacteria bacterium]
MITIHIEDETGMLKLGGELAHQLDGEGSVLIKGDLGAGKTTLCRGLIHAMGHEGAVKSPTFTLVEPYRIGKRDIFHFDLYRLSHPDELEYIGIDEYFGENRLCLVEWPEKAAGH